MPLPALPNYPSPAVKAFGDRVGNALFDAQVRHAMAGLGGCKVFLAADFDADLLPYIEAYLEGNLDSTAIVYAAMRTKSIELGESQ